MMNLKWLGMPAHHFAATPKVVAPAKRQDIPPSPEAQVHVVKLLSSLLNVETSGKFLESTPHFSGQLRYEIEQVTKWAKKINLRMMAEGQESITSAIDTLNERSNLLNQACLLIANYPADITIKAMQAAADVCDAWRNPPRRKANRLKSSTKQAA